MENQTRLSLTNLLKRVPIFSRLSQKDLEDLAESLKVKRCPKNTIVFNEGDVEDGLYLIAKGKVKVVLWDEEGRGITLSVMEPGDFFGEMAVFDDLPRSATVEAVEDTTFFVLEKHKVLELIERNPSIARHILREMSLRLREADDKIRTLAHFDVAGRLARYLMELLKKEGKIIRHKDVAYVQIPNRNELANTIGASRETVSRILSALQKRGIISVRRNNLIIYNIKELEWRQEGEGQG